MATQKLQELKEESREAIVKEVVTKGEKLEERGDMPSLSVREALGMCWDCKYCAITEFEFTGFVAICNYHEQSLSHRDRVVRCNSYMKRGQMSLWDMRDIAYLIEPDKKKVGFNLGEDN